MIRSGFDLSSIFALQSGAEDMSSVFYTTDNVVDEHPHFIFIKNMFLISANEAIKSYIQKFATDKSKYSHFVKEHEDEFNTAFYSRNT